MVAGRRIRVVLQRSAPRTAASAPSSFRGHGKLAAVVTGRLERATEPLRQRGPVRRPVHLAQGNGEGGGQHQKDAIAPLRLERYEGRDRYPSAVHHLFDPPAQHRSLTLFTSFSKGNFRPLNSETQAA